MRLLNVYDLTLSDFHEPTIPSYVIASHRWTGDKASYKDVLYRRNIESAGYKKIESFCAFVRKRNADLTRIEATEPKIEWIWIDTGCINKNSSAELSESINSMFKWYSRAHECYAYLADVRPLSDGRDATRADFKRIVWFSRGWTLQELLVPAALYS